MKRESKYFWSGIGIIVFLTVSYFIKITVDAGSNYQTIESLLAILIFQNKYVLLIYLLFALFLIVKGFESKRC